MFRSDLPIFAQHLNMQPSEFWGLTVAERAACIEYLNRKTG